MVNAQLRDRSGERRTLQAWAEILDGACELPLGAVYSAVWWGSLKVDEISPLALSSVAAA